jgi:chaperonin GroEL
MPKQTKTGSEARQALQRGVDSVADPVKVTLGPRGRNVLLDRPGQPLATRDGVTVAKEVSFLPDPFENMGAAFAREVADAAVCEAGDGTTTATVLLQAILREGIKLVDAGAEPMQLADGIQATAKLCADRIKELSIPATDELVKQVAYISTHGDEELAALIAQTTMKVGERGVIELQESMNDETTVEHQEGFYFERGWEQPNGANSGFVNDLTGLRCVLHNPLILISERTIVGFGTGPNDKGDFIWNILQKCVMEQKSLLIIAEDLIGDALNGLMANQATGRIKCGFVKLPGFGDQRAAAINDLQIAVGARRIHSNVSNRADDVLSTFTLDDLGACQKAIISPRLTVLVEGNANNMRLQNKVMQLITQSQEATNPFQKMHLDHRIARLTGGVSVLKVGAHSEPAMIERKARAEDAIHACRAALQEGVVMGGGMALYRTSAEAEIAMEHSESRDQTKGGELLLAAMMAPAKQIVKNAGYSVTDFCKSIDDEPNFKFGLNSATGAYGDLYQMGIVDPAKVVRTALLKAASIASLLLTSETLCCDLPVEKTAQQMPTPHYAM